jgi:hypothetical protein
MRKLDRGQLEDPATTMSAGSSPDDTPNAANYDGLWIRYSATCAILAIETCCDDSPKRKQSGYEARIP